MKLWKKKRDDGYVLILSCTSEIAEKAASAYINQNVEETILVKKCVSANRIELTYAIRLINKSTYFVNELLRIGGVEKAVLLCNSDAESTALQRRNLEGGLCYVSFDPTEKRIQRAVYKGYAEILSAERAGGIR